MHLTKINYSTAFRSTCEAAGAGGAAGVAAALLLPLPASAAGQKSLDDGFVENAAAATGLVRRRLGFQGALAPRDAPPQVAHLVGVQWFLDDDVGPWPYQRGLVAGDLEIQRQDCTHIWIDSETRG